MRASFKPRVFDQHRAFRTASCDPPKTLCKQFPAFLVLEVQNAIEHHQRQHGLAVNKPVIILKPWARTDTKGRLVESVLVAERQGELWLMPHIEANSPHCKKSRPIADAFVGGFTAARCRRLSLPQALLWGYAAGSLSVLRRGAQQVECRHAAGPRPLVLSSSTPTPPPSPRGIAVCGSRPSCRDSTPRFARRRCCAARSRRWAISHRASHSSTRRPQRSRSSAR